MPLKREASYGLTSPQKLENSLGITFSDASFKLHVVGVQLY